MPKGRSWTWRWSHGTSLGARAQKQSGHLTSTIGKTRLLRPASTAAGEKPRAARLPETRRLHRARPVGEVPWLQGDEALAGVGPLPSVLGEDGGCVGAVRERQAPIGHRRGPHEGRDRKGDEEGDAEGFELTWPSGSSSQRNGGAPSDDNRGDGAQLQAMEFVDWDGHRILDMSGSEWHFMVESHRAVARKSARASTHTHSADEVAASRRE